MADVSRVLPKQVYLQSLSAQSPTPLAPGAVAAAPTTPPRNADTGDDRRIGLLGDGRRVFAREGRGRPRPAREPALAHERDARVERERQHDGHGTVPRRHVHRHRRLQPDRRCEMIDRINGRLALLLAVVGLLASAWRAGSSWCRQRARRPRRSTGRSATRTSSSPRRSRSCRARSRSRASSTSVVFAARSRTTCRCRRSSESFRGRPAGAASGSRASRPPSRSRRPGPRQCRSRSRSRAATSGSRSSCTCSGSRPGSRTARRTRRGGSTASTTSRSRPATRAAA